jgi:hypothetical protein
VVLLRPAVDELACFQQCAHAIQVGTSLSLVWKTPGWWWCRWREYGWLWLNREALADEVSVHRQVMV